MKLNNKGYLIVEVILAGVLTFTMAYFLINLTLKIRNRYDDTNVETVLLNDKTVVTNEVMDDVINNKVKNVEYIVNGIKITFEDDSSKDLTVVDNTITYGTYTKKFNENAILGNVNIKRNGNYFTLEIPITTKYSKDDYGINIVGFTEIPTEPITCTLKASGSEITATFSQDINLVYNGWDSAYADDNGNTSKSISTGTHTYYIKDDFGNTGMCAISIENVNKTTTTKYITQSTYEDWGATGSCQCWSSSITSGTCKANASSAWCECPSGYSTVSGSGNCAKKFNGRKCQYGWTKIDEYTCQKANGTSTVTSCPSDYTRIDKTDYCYK